MICKIVVDFERCWKIFETSNVIDQSQSQKLAHDKSINCDCDMTFQKSYYALNVWDSNVCWDKWRIRVCESRWKCVSIVYCSVDLCWRRSFIFWLSIVVIFEDRAMNKKKSLLRIETTCRKLLLSFVETRFCFDFTLNSNIFSIVFSLD